MTTKKMLIPFIVPSYSYERLKELFKAKKFEDRSLRDIAWKYFFIALIRGGPREALEKVVDYLLKLDIDSIERSYDDIVGFLMLTYIARTALRAQGLVSENLITTINTKSSKIIEDLKAKNFLRGLLDPNLLPELFFACALHSAECLKELYDNRNNSLKYALYLLVAYSLIDHDTNRRVQILQEIIDREHEVKKSLKASIEDSSLLLIAFGLNADALKKLVAKDENYVRKVYEYAYRALLTINKLIRDLEVLYPIIDIEPHTLYKVYIGITLLKLNKGIVLPEPMYTIIMKLLVKISCGFVPLPRNLHKKVCDVLEDIESAVTKWLIILQFVVPIIVSAIIAWTYNSMLPIYAMIGYIIPTAITFYHLLSIVNSARRVHKELEELEKHR